MLKKSIAILLSVLICLPIFSAFSYASAKEYELSGYYVDYYYDEDGAMHERYLDFDGNEVFPQDEPVFRSASTTLPSSYDSRDYDRVTSVKNQSPFGTCWSFSYCSAAESSLISQGYATKDTIDLSEAHLVWFRSANYIEDSTIPVQRDKATFSDGYNTFTNGGNNESAAATVSRWSGFTTEAKYPYVSNSDISYMSFDSSAMFDNDYNLVSSVTYSKSTDTAAIKEAIMRSGALSSSYYHSGSYMKSVSGVGKCYYQNAQTGTNHAITIVGWDDNFSASNFSSTPSGNGAWLVKNSWGTSSSDNGYFWLSYYDTSNVKFCEVVAKPSGNYDNNYQYDGVVCTGYLGYGSTTVYAANIFKSAGKEIVKGAGFYANKGYSCTVYLYTGLTSTTNPKSGTLRETKTLTATGDGYYTVDFSNTYNLSKGEKFSIVIKYTASSNATFYCEPKQASDRYTYYGETGQSFCSSSGSSWTDICSSGKGYNIPIKAFTKNVVTKTLSSISIDSLPTKTQYYVGDTFDSTGLVVKANYSDGSSQTVSDYSLSGFNSSSAGTKTITVTYGGKTNTFNVTVNAVQLTSISVNTNPTKTSYTNRDTELNTSGLKIQLNYNSGKTEYITSGFNVGQADFTKSGNQSITVTYGGFETNFNITVSKYADYSAVDQIVAEADLLLQSGSYTTQSKAKLNMIIESIDYDLWEADQSVVDGYVASIRNAINGLVKVHKHTGEKTQYVEIKALSEVLTDGNYFVDNDITAVEDLYIDGTVNICLDGHSINMDEYSIIVTEGSEFNIKDCTSGGSVVSSADCCIDNEGTVSLQSVSISGNLIGIVNVGELILSGAPSISGSYADVKFEDDGLITFDSIYSGGIIDIYFDAFLELNDSIIFTSGWSEYMSSYDGDNIFNLIYTDCEIVVSEGELAVEHKKVLYPGEDTSCVVDDENGVIYGLSFGMDSIGSYLDLEDGYTYSCDGYGTGSEVKIFEDGVLIGTYEIVVFGDLTGDSWADGTDTMLVKCICANMLTLDNIGYAAYSAADCNHDGVVDELDVELLEQAGVMLEDVPQNATQTELLSSQSYIDYCNLISQTIPAKTEAVETEEVVEKSTSIYEHFIEFIIRLIENIFSWYK